MFVSVVWGLGVRLEEFVEEVDEIVARVGGGRGGFVGFALYRERGRSVDRGGFVRDEIFFEEGMEMRRPCLTLWYRWAIVIRIESIRSMRGMMMMPLDLKRESVCRRGRQYDDAWGCVPIHFCFVYTPSPRIRRVVVVCVSDARSIFCSCSIDSTEPSSRIL